MITQEAIHIAYFISAHGFGHASRASAVMAAIGKELSSIHFDIFTQVPRWFFDEALSGLSFTIFPEKTDIGLIQKKPMEQDLDATLLALDRFLPFENDNLHRLAESLWKLNSRLVICDISPLGLAVASEANIPSILIENFTWDWIYEAYLQTHSGFEKHITYLKEIFSTAQYHIQTEPLCKKFSNAALITFPVSRKPRQTPSETRRKLRIPTGGIMALVTMGGIPEEFGNLEGVQKNDQVYLVVPGGYSDYLWKDHLILLPHHSSFYHPDLISASDVVMGKAGYSTIAEIYHAGTPFGFVSRSDFREAQPLADFIRREMNGFEISEEIYLQQRWGDALPALLEIPRIKRTAPNGADQIAQFICALLAK